MNRKLKQRSVGCGTNRGPNMINKKMHDWIELQIESLIYNLDLVWYFMIDLKNIGSNINVFTLLKFWWDNLTRFLVVKANLVNDDSNFIFNFFVTPECGFGVPSDVVVEDKKKPSRKLCCTPIRYKKPLVQG
jgi:hypothetical protein